MSRQINLPINQVRLTNVAVVRMNKGGKRFEIACYRNKVVNYRQGLEQDLSEVLQTERIFTNVSKGEFAKAKDLQKVFDTKDEEEISKLILMKGQLQVSDKERSQQLEKTSAQIADWLSKNCVNPSSERPYTVFQIREALNKASFSVHPTKPLKRQYLECVKLLQKVMPIRRAQMELLVLVPSSSPSPSSGSGGPGGSEGIAVMEEEFTKHNVSWTATSSTLEGGGKEQRHNTHQTYRIFVEPSLYRVLNDVTQLIDGARIEIVTQVVTKQGDSALDGALLGFVSAEGNTTIGVSSSVSSIPHSTSQQNRHSEQEESPRGLNNNVNLPLDPAASKIAATSGDSDDGSNDDAENENDAAFSTMNRRQQQKHAKKKNKKARRREKESLEVEDGSSSAIATNMTSLCISAEETGGSLESRTATTPQKSMALQTTATATGAGTSANGLDRKSCNTCGGDFATPSSYRAHFKSDWHRFNQKLKLKGATPISEQEFLMCDSDNTGTSMLPSM